MGMKGCWVQTGSDIELIKTGHGEQERGHERGMSREGIEWENDSAINETLLT